MSPGAIEGHLEELKKQLKDRHFLSDTVIATAETWLDGQLSFFLVDCKSITTG
jgi:hypothetical protein